MAPRPGENGTLLLLAGPAELPQETALANDRPTRSDRAGRGPRATRRLRHGRLQLHQGQQPAAADVHRRPGRAGPNSVSGPWTGRPPSRARTATTTPAATASAAGGAASCRSAGSCRASAGSKATTNSPSTSVPWRAAAYGRYLVQTQRQEWAAYAGLAYTGKTSRVTSSRTAPKRVFGTQYSFFRYDSPEASFDATLNVYPSLTSERPHPQRGPAALALRDRQGPVFRDQPVRQLRQRPGRAGRVEFRLRPDDVAGLSF